MTFLDLDHPSEQVKAIAAQHLPDAIVRDLGGGKSRLASRALDDLGDAELQSIISSRGIRVTRVQRTKGAA
jgi:hypothetical protein